MCYVSISCSTTPVSHLNIFQLPSQYIYMKLSNTKMNLTYLCSIEKNMSSTQNARKNIEYLFLIILIEILMFVFIVRKFNLKLL